MICEPMSAQLSIVKLDQPLEHTVWLGHPPALFRLATVDLGLPRNTKSGSHITMFVDPLMQERYALHDGGIDSIMLHYLPFTSQSCATDDTVRTPSVHPVLSTCQGETYSLSPLYGFVSLSDSFGYSWIVGVVGVISTHECIVLEMKSWKLLLPIQIDTDTKPKRERKETHTPDIISKELLVGPKMVLHPQASPNLHSVAADSIEGIL